eukprot:Pgem_evm1s782
MKFVFPVASALLSIYAECGRAEEFTCYAIQDHLCGIVNNTENPVPSAWCQNDCNNPIIGHPACLYDFQDVECNEHHRCHCFANKECAPFDSVDCKSEYANAVQNNNLASFYSRCETEGGANPLRTRCSKCCKEEDGNNSDNDSDNDSASGSDTESEHDDDDDDDDSENSGNDDDDDDDVTTSTVDQQTEPVTTTAIDEQTDTIPDTVTGGETEENNTGGGSTVAVGVGA